MIRVVMVVEVLGLLFMMLMMMMMMMMMIMNEWTTSLRYSGGALCTEVCFLSWLCFYTDAKTMPGSVLNL